MTRWRLGGLWTMVLTALAASAGCGEKGPEKYQVTGAVVCAGQPVMKGDIFFEPKEGLANTQTMGRAFIKDGRYTVEIVGGTHKVNIRDFTGSFDFDPEGAQKGVQPVLRVEYHGEVDYPLLADVKDSAPVQKDIEVPAKYLRK